MERGGAWQRMEYEQAARLDGLCGACPQTRSPRLNGRTAEIRGYCKIIRPVLKCNKVVTGIMNL